MAVTADRKMCGTETFLEVSWSIGDDGTETCGTRARSRSLTEPEPPQTPTMTPNGIRLGTPVAREAAKSFWSMDMLKTSLNRMAFYADCENHSSEGSIGSSDSGFQSRGPSARSTPTVSKLPLITTAISAPSTPQSATRHESLPSFPSVSVADSNESLDAESGITTLLLNPPPLCPVEKSPLLMARRQREATSLACRTPTTDSNHSTASLTSSSKTISPSLSTQLLLPRRKQLSRSRSAEQRNPVKPSLLPKSLRVARSDSSVHRLGISSFLMEFRRATP